MVLNKEELNRVEDVISTCDFFIAHDIETTRMDVPKLLWLGMACYKLNTALVKLMYKHALLEKEYNNLRKKDTPGKSANKSS